MSQRIVRLFLLVFLWATASHAAVYDYPFVNPYEATVIGTPSFYMPPLPEEIPVNVYKVTVFEDRKIPKVFWYTEGLEFSLARQKGEAPLIFLVAGTGGSYASGKMKILQKAFYQAGFHVLSLTSPTHTDFIVNASTTSVPGHVVEDSRDLYQVMKLAYEKVRAKVSVSAFHITGYSLGAVHAAFAARLDQQEKAFGIEKVLLINPAVNLYNSVEILDNLLTSTIDTHDPVAVKRFVDGVMTAFAETYERTQTLDLGGDFLYEVYKTRQPKEESLETLIGVSFRFSSRDLIFASDVMTKAGYVVPSNRNLTATASLTPYFKVLGQTGFTDYYREYFLPFFQIRYPGLTDAQLREQMSLGAIEAFLRENSNVGLLGNEDDIILAPGEIDYLKSVFGDRATLYPTGGHCGNLAHKVVLGAIVDYFVKR